MNAGAYNTSYAAQGAYQSAQTASEDPRSREYRLFIQVTAQLERAAEQEEINGTVGLALHDNRRLWNALMEDLSGEGNLLPKPLKAQLISLGIWVNRHCSLVLRGEAQVQPLIDVNRMIIAGLAQQQETQSEVLEAVGGIKA